MRRFTQVVFGVVIVTFATFYTFRADVAHWLHFPNGHAELWQARVSPFDFIFPHIMHSAGTSLLTPAMLTRAVAIVLGIVYYITMLFGIIIGTAYDGLSKADPNTKLRPADILEYGFTPEGWPGMLASPLMFSILMGTGVTSSLAFATFLLAFQNGFFWRATMAKYNEVRHRRR